MHVRNLLITLALASAAVVTGINPAYALTPGQATTPVTGTTPAPTTSTTPAGAPKISDVLRDNPDIAKWGQALLAAPVECYNGAVSTLAICTRTHWDTPARKAGCDDPIQNGVQVNMEWDKQAKQCLGVTTNTDGASSAALASLGLRVTKTEKKVTALEGNVSALDAESKCQQVALGGTLPAGFTATRDAMNGQVEVKDSAGAVVCSGIYTALVETRAVGQLAADAMGTATGAMTMAQATQSDFAGFRTAQTETNAGFLAGITRAQGTADNAEARAANAEAGVASIVTKLNNGQYGMFTIGGGIMSSGGHTGPAIQGGWGMEGTYGGFNAYGNFGLLSEYSDAYGFGGTGFVTPVPAFSIGLRGGYQSLGVGSTDADGSAEVVVNGALLGLVAMVDLMPLKPNGLGLEVQGGGLFGQSDILRTGDNTWGYKNGGGVTTFQASALIVYRFGGKTKDIAWSPYAVSAPVAPAPATSTAAPAGSPPPM